MSFASNRVVHHGDKNDDDDNDAAAEMKKESRDVELDIQGLRGVAVLAIVLFHVNGLWLPGGFVGVDVFFVISGYLITRNIAANLDDKTFSFSDFYAKRVRRISPAAMMTTFASFVIGCILFTEYDLRNLRNGVLAAVLGSTNVYETYFADYGYFAAKSAMNPLLHLWSLAVEEQFYFVWPMVMKQLWQFPFRMRIGVVGLIVLASFVWAQIAAPSSFAYYMLPCRAGELLVGALTALLLRDLNDDDVLRRGRSSKILISVVGLVGFAAVAASCLRMNERIVFPGISALPAVLGTALMLLSGHRKFKNVSVVSRLLSAFYPLRFLGEASYSVYLCHWPVLAFFRYLHVPVGGVGSAMTTFAYIISSSLFLHHFVETHFRWVRWNKSRIFLVLLVVPLLLISGITVLSSASSTRRVSQPSPPLIRKDTPSPSPSSSSFVDISPSLEVRSSGDCALVGNVFRRHVLHPPLRWDNVTSYWNGWAQCTLTTPNLCFIGQANKGELCVNSNRKDRCTLGDISSSSECNVDSVGYFGDSHGAHYVGMIEEFALAAKFRFFNNMKIGCRAYYYPGIDASLLCNPDFPKNLLRFRGRTVIWVNYFAQNIYSEYHVHIVKTLEYMLSLGIKVLILGTLVTLKTFPNACPFPEPPSSSLWHWCSAFSYSKSCLESRLHNSFLKELTIKYPNVSYWDANDYICPAGICYPYVNGMKIFLDVDHITYKASRALGKQIIEASGVPMPFLKIRQTECSKKNGS